MSILQDVKKNTSKLAVDVQKAELEEEYKKLKAIQKEVSVKMSLPSISPSVSTATIQSLEDKTEADQRSVFVGNVDFGAATQALERHFEKCGSIRKVSIQTNKFTLRPKGFAYVEFEKRSGAQAAIALNGTKMLGRQIIVTPKRTNEPGIPEAPVRGGFGRGRGRGGRGANANVLVYKYVPRGNGNGFHSRGGRGTRGRPGFAPF